ncbi:MAG: hypothetical protein ACRDOO_09960 [Actinomadura sp.]
MGGTPGRRQRERRLAILKVAAATASSPISMSPVLMAESLAFLPPGPAAGPVLGAVFADVVVFSDITFMSGRIMVLPRLQVLDGRSPAARACGVAGRVAGSVIGRPRAGRVPIVAGRWRPQPAAVPESVMSPGARSGNLAVRILDATLCDHEDKPPKWINEMGDLTYSGRTTVYRRSP